MGDSVAELVMQTDTLRVTVLPAMGGKIASLQWLPEKVELLQAPLAPYGMRTLTMGFEESDAGGWDECLPSVAACEVETGGGKARIPDHGDLWRLRWEAAQNGNEMRMAAKGVSLPLRLERTLRLEGDELRVHYGVLNEGTQALPWAWSAHPLFAVDPGDRLLLPPSVTEVRIEGSAHGRLGAKGTRHPWPRTHTATGDAVDLSVAGAVTDGTGDKVFAETPGEGWAAIERKQSGLLVEMSFDARKNPWLGLWLCYGGWPEGARKRQQCIAIEPCTAPADSLAEAMGEGWGRRLEPGASEEWTLQIRVKRVSLG